MNAFVKVNSLLKNVGKLFEEEDEKKHWMMKQIAQFDHLLVVVRYVKENFETMRDIMQNMEDRVKCRQNCMRIVVATSGLFDYIILYGCFFLASI